MRIEISREEILLDTGGGLKKAAWFFLENSGSAHPGGRESSFIVHNVDVLSTIDLSQMMEFHHENRSVSDAGGTGSQDVSLPAFRRA